MSTVDAVAHALRLLRLLEEGGPAGLASLTRAAGLTNSRGHRLLATLVESGYVYRLPGDKLYRAASGRGGAPTVDFSEALELCYPLLTELRDASDETAHLGALAGRNVYFLACAESTQLMRVTSRAGSRVPAHATAVGKVLLASRSDDELRSLLGAEPLAARTEHTIVDLADLLVEVGRARALGYARNRAESELGMSVLAVPVRIGDGLPSFSLSLSGPESRINPRRTTALSPRERELLALLQDAARRVQGG